MQSARLQDYNVFFENGEEYHSIKREVWGKDVYYFEAETEEPVIIDGGAHIGLATLYWKRLYPRARVVAIEPLSENLEILKKNIWENQLSGVEVVEAALSDREGEERFYLDKSENRWYSTAGFTRGAWNEEQESEERVVRTSRLGDYLEKWQPELVKLDIEGAEGKVLWEAREKLRLAKRYMVEVHPGGRGVEELQTIFEERGFELAIHKGASRSLRILEAVKRG
jgi:FkbM family methyltransferase